MIRTAPVSALALGFVLLTVATVAHPVQAQTNIPDFINLQYPAQAFAYVGELTGPFYGTIFEPGVTQPEGVPINVFAEFGVGPLGSDPRSSSAWSWTTAMYHTQVGGNDEFRAFVTAPAIGEYSYTYRYQLSEAAPWTVADLDGNGSNAGLSFDVGKLGLLTVVGPTVAQVDSATLTHPGSLSLSALATGGPIFAQFFEQGLTAPVGEPADVFVQLGVGPAGTNPAFSGQWTWTDALYSRQIGSSEEYRSNLTAPAVNGTYWYTMRFRLGQGGAWTVADLDGAGTNGGLSLDMNQLGVLTVTGGVNAPAYAAADFNRDGHVDGNDLAYWKFAHQFDSVSPADADGDGDTDGNDFVIWQRQLSASVSAAAPIDSAVPEPCAAVLALLAVVASGVCRQRS